METLQCDERLTIARARHLVEHAESTFALGSSIPDAFEPFAEAGAIDRQEAYTALLLVIADYFVATRSSSHVERERFELYVKQSRLIAVRIVCDGLNSTDAITSLTTECARSFDSFTEWLSTQDHNSNNFWPITYKRLDIDKASSPALDLCVLLTFDMSQLTELIGRTFRLPTEDALSRFRFELQSASGNSQYLTCKSHGLSVLLEESAVAAIFLYKSNDNGYATFPHRLIGGISFGDRRSSVRAVLGKPSRSNGIAYIYINGEKSLHFEFREWLGTLKMVVVSQQYRA
jgi:hypothetical protein